MTGVESAEEAVEHRPRRRGLSRLTSRATPAILTQFVTAGSSLVLQVLVARWLGATALGSFAIFLALLGTLNAVQSGWLGDSLTVLDRFNPQIRGALFFSQWAIVGLAAIIGGGLSYMLGVGNAGVSALCALATVAWCVEETGRRMLMARLEFWKLMVNDSVYAVAAIAFACFGKVSGQLSFGWVIASMAVGSSFAIAVALFQVPTREWRPGRRGSARRGLGQLSRFAKWRAGQSGLRPLGLLLLRVLIVLFTSRAVLGELEAARLLVAPAMTVIAGSGLFLLPVYAHNEKLGGAARKRNGPNQVMVLLSGATAFYGLIAVIFVVPLTKLLTSGSIQPSRVAVVAWIIWTIGYASPHGNLAVARQMSREVFALRLIDSVIGLLLVTGLLVVGWDDLSPAGAGIGMLIGTWFVARLLKVRE